ncbi:hypothetical protein EZJ49_10180 [Bdellovibrio bacteriovorus]|uniref:hypothetical protein n=1 Tax=Bdellovibrio bacteriovorus TaxID=959 RepID=UPI0021CE4B84|nr:hypothetical protein [Bdellovibrio bacteriovorus]UXR63442.1 hypothetical protein EZJ49_10180 [Bdellovibrio bacteriovorus]
MKKILTLLFLLTIQAQSAHAQSLRNFLATCGWGVVGGAALGVVSLAFEDKPSESWNNVARGASLGLYAGMGYGLYAMNRPPATYQQPDFAIIPTFEKGQVEGVRITKTLFDF